MAVLYTYIFKNLRHADELEFGEINFERKYFPAVIGVWGVLISKKDDPQRSILQGSFKDHYLHFTAIKSPTPMTAKPMNSFMVIGSPSKK